ncbi:hypothetical protein BH18ACI4_BH18ACI4_03710 [soil metagenome]
MNRLLLVLFLCTMTAVFFACSKGQKLNGETSGGSPTAAAGPKTTSESVVKVAVHGVEIPAGGIAEAIVRVTVRSGFHVNSNPPSYPYLKATELNMTDTDEISLNSVFYPKPLVKKFAFADEPLHVYEGETPLTVALKAAPTAKKGQQSIPARLRIQACDDQVCYPPGSVDVVIPVLVK